MKTEKHNSRNQEKRETALSSFFSLPSTLNPEPFSRGFTLIEMIVSVSIFTVVMFVAVGALLAITDANRKANAIRTTMDNLNFAVGSMARDIRTGTEYGCSGVGNCSSGGSLLEFLDQTGATVRYWYDESTHSIKVSKNGGISQSITSSEIRIEDLTFYVTGVGDDGFQPRVVITIKGKTGLKLKTQVELNVQTTVSQREIES